MIGSSIPNSTQTLDDWKIREHPRVPQIVLSLSSWTSSSLHSPSNHPSNHPSRLLPKKKPTQPPGVESRSIYGEGLGNQLLPAIRREVYFEKVESPKK